MNTALKLVKGQDPPASKDYINRFVNSEPKEGVLFYDFIHNTVLKKSKRMGKNYMQNYATVIYHLKNFSTLNQASIFTNSVNEDFLDDFICYLQDQDLKLTYIRSLVGLIKSMARKAGSYGFAVDPTYDDVTLDDEETNSVYLSMNEITRVYFFKGLTRKQQQIRDLFVVGCLTALRYSDYSTLTCENFQGEFIVKVTKKTSKKVIIPVHDYITEIYKRYDGEISKGLSIQHFNRYVKKICKLVGIEDPITFTYTRGGNLVTETHPKWKLISSHTARRSAATNLYLTGRLKTYEIMAITGHTTEKSFFKYIKVTNEDISKHVAGDSFFRK